MWIILKTFELSKNPLVHLFYLILIITTVSHQQVKESDDPPNKQTDNEPVGTDHIPSNVEEASTVNDGTGGTNNVLQGLIERLNSKNNILPTKENEINSMGLKENDIVPAGNGVEDKDVEEDEDPFKDTKIGLKSSEEDKPKEQTSMDLKEKDVEEDEDPFKDTKIGLKSSEEDKPKEQTSMDLKEKDIVPAGNGVEDKDVEEDEDPFEDTETGLRNSEEQTNSKKQTKNKNKQKQKTENVGDNDLETGSESNTIVGTSDTLDSTIAQISDPEGNPTENQNPVIENNPEDSRRKAVGQILKNMNARLYNTPKTNENEIDNINPDEKKIGVDEDPKEMELNLSPDLKTPGDVEPEEQTNSKINKKQTSENVDADELETGAGSNTIVGTSDTIESTVTEISYPEKNHIEDTEDEPFAAIQSNELTVSTLDKIEIIKIKGNPTNESETFRKEKKRAVFKEFTPQGAEARIYCTFLGNVLKMYNKVRKRFVGHFCHAIVFGTPIILKQHRVHLSQKMKDQLSSIQIHKKESLIIVIMEFTKYKLWKHALRDNKDLKNNLIIDIIHTVVKYNIDGIQFSNLHPTKKGAKINSQMMNNLITFFEDLQRAAEKKKHELKIGINIDLDGLPIANSFTSFKNLNPLVTWYTFKSISMVTCSSAYRDTGTSPLQSVLEGDMGFETTIKTLIENINNNYEFEMSKLVVGIQLFPNKVNELHPYTYEEFCAASERHTFCAADTEDLKAKGTFLRGTQIGGLQLYYMHCDDYRSSCGCYSFPLIRALLRGLIKVKTPEPCFVKTAHN